MLATQERLLQTSVSRGTLAFSLKEMINPQEDASNTSIEVRPAVKAYKTMPNQSISISTAKRTQPTATPSSVKESLLFDTSEAAEDEAIWEAKFASTPDDKLHRLAEKIRTQIRAGKAKPLDFTNR